MFRVKWLLLAGLAISAASCDPSNNNPANSGGKFGEIPPAALTARAIELKGTIITPHLEQKMELGKNVMWCASFQLAWNELMDYAGGPIVMTPQPPMADILNRREFSKAEIDSGSVAAAAGRVDGVLTEIQSELARKFGEAADPQLLDQFRNFPHDSVAMYAYLMKQLPFETPFGRLDYGYFSHLHPSIEVPEEMESTQVEVETFGIEDYKPEDKEQAAMAQQVRILWYEIKNEADDYATHFVVELKTASQEDRLLFAMIPPEQTLGATVAKVQSLILKPNTLRPGTDYQKTVAKAYWKKLGKSREDLSEEEQWDIYEDMTRFVMDKLTPVATLIKGDSISLPVLDFDITKSFPELCGKPVASGSPDVDGLPFAFAEQRIRFKLNELGAKLESEGGGVLFGGPPSFDFTRYFGFYKPFLVFLIRKGASKPYFALWVGNDELLARQQTDDDQQE